MRQDNRVNSPDWHAPGPGNPQLHGEGFIVAASGKRPPAKHVTGRLLIEPKHLNSTASISGLKKVTATKFKSSYSPSRFTAPMLLIHEDDDLASRDFDEGYFVYKDKIVGIAQAESRETGIRRLGQWIELNRRSLQAFACAGGTTVFTQRANWVGLFDIRNLPVDFQDDLSLSPTECILVDDIVDYYRDLVRLGERSVAMRTAGVAALGDFNDSYTRQINAVYKKNKLRALSPQTWPSFLCQPYVFGKGDVDWSGTDELKDKLDALLREERGAGLQVTRVARIYDGASIYLLKPDRLRYWLRSIALRDADETLADLWNQGF